MPFPLVSFFIAAVCAPSGTVFFRNNVYFFLCCRITTQHTHPIRHLLWDDANCFLVSVDAIGHCCIWAPKVCEFGHAYVDPAFLQPFRSAVDINA